MALPENPQVRARMDSYIVHSSTHYTVSLLSPINNSGWRKGPKRYHRHFILVEADIFKQRNQDIWGGNSEKDQLYAVESEAGAYSRFLIYSYIHDFIAAFLTTSVNAPFGFKQVNYVEGLDKQSSFSPERR